MAEHVSKIQLRYRKGLYLDTVSKILPNTGLYVV